jgi:hypothetical protein
MTKSGGLCLGGKLLLGDHQETLAAGSAYKCVIYSVPNVRGEQAFWLTSVLTDRLEQSGKPLNRGAADKHEDTTRWRIAKGKQLIGAT